MKSVARALSLDLWVCTYYRVLPTDERYVALTTKQKELLLLTFLEQPSEDELRMSYRESRKRDSEFRVNPSNLRRTGYTEEQIRRIREQLKIAREAVANTRG